MEPTAQPVDQPTTKNFQQQEKTKKPFFVSKLFFIIIIGLTFFVLVTIGYFLLVKRELKTTISPSDLPLGNPITTKSKSDKFEIPTATQSGKKVLLKYNGGDEELLYAISLSLDKKWLTYYLLGEKTEIINLQNKAQHKIPFKKGGYWEKIVWASDNKSFYAAVKVGLPIPSEAFCQLYLVSLDDLERALDLPFEKVKYLYTIASAMAPVITAMLVALFEKKGISSEGIALTIQNEILKEFVCRGSYVFPPRPSMRLAADVIEYQAKYQPNWKPISICGAHLGSSGATCSQEVGFALSFAFAYMESVLERGLNIDSVAPRFEFLFCAHMDIFEEVAKIRAARKLWAKLVKERYGAKDPHSLSPRFLVDASGITLTSQQPLNNIARLTLQGLACVLSGADYVVIPSYDEAMAIPSQDAVRVSAAIQNIIAYESGVPNTVDPLGGSYYVEYLTKKIEDEAIKVIDKVDSMGGAIKAIELGFFQQQLADSAYRWQKDVEAGKTSIIGINRLKVEDEKPIEIFRIESGAEKRQIKRLKKVRKERDSAKVKEALRNVKEAAKDQHNLIPPLIEAVKSYVTIGEIRDTLIDIFGEYREDTTRIG